MAGLEAARVVLVFFNNCHGRGQNGYPGGCFRFFTVGENPVVPIDPRSELRSFQFFDICICQTGIAAEKENVLDIVKAINFEAFGIEGCQFLFGQCFLVHLVFGHLETQEGIFG